MTKVQIYYDDCHNYDGEPGWLIRMPGEVCDMSLDATTEEDAITEMLSAGYTRDEIEVIEAPE